MKYPVLILLFFLPQSLFAIQKAKIVDDEVEVYSEQDFDSDVLDIVHQGETYSISNNTFGPFYKIKLKSGKVGYIVDYVLDIEGKGRLKPKDMDQLDAQNAMVIKDNPETAEAEAEEEEASLGRVYAGPSIQLINYHEETLGAGQVNDFLAVGYKSVSVLSWSALASFNAPKYYAAGTGGSASGGMLWLDLGYSNTMANFNKTEIRFAGSFFSHISILHVETPIRKYDLHDITLGLALEGAVLFKIKSHALDLGLKYYFDRSNYAGLSLSFLF